MCSQVVWQVACQKILKDQNHIPAIEKIDLRSFSVDTEEHRYTLRKKTPAFIYCQQLFPWFGLLLKKSRKKIRLRETLSKENYSVHDVIDAINYFGQRALTSKDIAILKDIYREMKIPSASHCLSTITWVYREFKQKVDEPLCSPAEWQAACQNMPQSFPTPLLTEDICLASFTMDQDSRYSLLNGSDVFNCCQQIFPWFRLHNNALYEEYLSSTAINNVIASMNDFFRRSITSEEVTILQGIYRSMKIPSASHCLSTIVVVHNAFKNIVHTIVAIERLDLSITSTCVLIESHFRPLMSHVADVNQVRNGATDPSTSIIQGQIQLLERSVNDMQVEKRQLM